MAVREQRDVTQLDVARALGVSGAAVSQWESGERSPREDALAKLAAFLGVTPAYLRYGVRETGEAVPAAEHAPQSAPPTPDVGEGARAYFARVEKEKAAQKGGRKRANGRGDKSA